MYSLQSARQQSRSRIPSHCEPQGWHVAVRVEGVSTRMLRIFCGIRGPLRGDRCPSRDVVAIRAALQNDGIDLNPSQWNALDRALTRRLHLIWAAWKRQEPNARDPDRWCVPRCLAAQNTPLRILVSAFTWAAIDNVLLACIDELARILPGGIQSPCVRSTSHVPDLTPAYQFADVELARPNASQAVHDSEVSLSEFSALFSWARRLTKSTIICRSIMPTSKSFST